MKKFLWVIVAIILIAGTYYWFNGRSKSVQTPVPNMADRNATATTSPHNSQPVATTTAPAAKPTNSIPAPKAIQTQSGSTVQGTFSSGEGDASGSSIQVYEVDYDGSKFSPSTIAVNVNDYVFFKNVGRADFWPMADAASAYPAFNAGQNIAAGKEFKFQFTKAGQFKYIDKLNPSASGTVTVAN